MLGSVVNKLGNGTERITIVSPTSLSVVVREPRSIAPSRASRREPFRGRRDTTLPKLRFHHYQGVQWILTDGPMAEAYVPVVVHDDCQGCLVCSRTTEWFMEFARVACRLTGINLRDCLHWGHLFDNPKPLIVPTSNLLRCNHEALGRLRESYFSLGECSRPPLQDHWPSDHTLSQSERFEDRLTIVSRMVELWEDGQYIGWPS
ncbi:hypothetical protein MELA_00602 [Candidatus Methylomirabilis lanthanidiphila]|uniref:Uncharacterized protein n=1 Tax=Candidatus Methylomirabilis lanthanidiphila TaxID=2211376 RepID=A0A564ZHU9_9BACT|nr:hypothetical protein [Candidatus Methylomirabilis lanthanidiphila]VUZ84232.1 hypothetical protein MELA_00602 [Candidatus Methylomirabilis lanthanidiphila]